MITQNEMHRWTNLEDWSEIPTIDKIDIDLDLIDEIDDLKRLLFAIEKSCLVLKLNFIDYQVRNITFLIYIIEWITEHNNRIDRLGFDIVFSPLIIEDWIVQIEGFETFISKLNNNTVFFHHLKHLSLKFDLRFVQLPHLISYFSNLLHQLSEPNLLEILQISLIGGVDEQLGNPNNEINYYDSQYNFASGFYHLQNLRELELKLFPLQRAPQHKYIYTQPLTDQVCYAEEYIANWIRAHQKIRSIQWDMYYMGLLEIEPIIRMLANPLIQDFYCIIDCPPLNIFVDNELETPIFYHQRHIDQLGKILKFHPHLVNLKLDCYFDKIQYVNRSGYPFPIMPSHIHSKIVHHLLRPISENKLIQSLSMDLGGQYPEITELFSDNTNLHSLDMKNCQNNILLKEKVKQNSQSLDILMDILIDQNFLQINTAPHIRIQNSLMTISLREIHRIDHLLWIKAFPAFICMARNSFERLDESRKHSYDLAKLIMVLYIGDLTQHHLGQDVCMYIANFLNFIPDMMQLHFMQGGILRRNMRSVF